jgi:predicted dehydrogenase
MDQDHFQPALAAIDKGYNVLLEKPMGATPEECCRIERAATEKGVFVLVCHVLRFTPFFRTIKKFIEEGKLGRVMHIQHTEGVGNLHYSHSFVRGNWCNSETSAPMILAKCCHDMDILAFLLDQKCTKVQSFGELTYFTRENAPEGAPDFCHEGCPHADTCYYNAPWFYIEKFGTKGAFTHAMTKNTQPTVADIEYSLRNTDYGRCVYKCNNNVVDNQIVNLAFENGSTASLTMSAFTKGGRKITLMGTNGELTGEMEGKYLSFFNFATRKTEEINIRDYVGDESQDGGHGGGDEGIIKSLVKWLDGDFSDKSVCTIEETCYNHLIAFAAEKARVEGVTVDVAAYKNDIMKEI